jgi:HlyD family secretion protein
VTTRNALFLASLMIVVAVLPMTLAIRARTARASVPPAAAPIAPAMIRAEGRVVTYPNGHATLAAEIGGTVRAVRAKEGQRVKKGDVIVEFDRSEQQAALAEAWAHVGEADAQLKYSSSEAKRARALVDAEAIALQAAERSSEERNAARARRRAAGAATQRLAASLEKARIVAPLDGTVIARTVEPGEVVTGGAPLIALADLDALRVEAEIDEFDAMRVQIGGAVKIGVDGLPGQTWEGRIEEIPGVVVPRKIKPQDPARPTDSRVLLVKVSLPAQTPLKLGQRVNLTLTSR